MAEYGWGYNQGAVPDRLSQMRMAMGQAGTPGNNMGQNVGQMGQQSENGHANALEVPNGWVGLNFVVSEAEAQCIPVQWGNTVVAFNYNDPIAYVKSMSSTGKPGFWAFRMTLLKPKTDDQFVTREEYTRLLDENTRMMAVVQQLAQEWGLSDERKSNDAAATTVRPDVQRAEQSQADGDAVHQRR